MKLYLAAIPALLLCACATTPPPAPSCPLPQAVEVGPVSVELGRKFDAQAFACSDDLACLKKLSGACPNGYSSSRPLMAGANKQVGVLFRCISDQDVADEKAEELLRAQENAAWKAERAAARKAAEAEAQKKQTKPKK
jgi:hypothetical protein